MGQIRNELFIHHFILGGGVQNGKFYGAFPLLAPGSSDDANTPGVLNPSTAVENFPTSKLGFLG